MLSVSSLTEVTCPGMLNSLCLSVICADKDEKLKRQKDINMINLVFNIPALD